MKKKILLLCLSLFILGCSNQDTRKNIDKENTLTEKEYLKKYGDTLSLEEILEINRDRNLDLKIKQLEREIATLDKKITFGNFLPSINILGGYTKLDNNIDINIDTSSLTSFFPIPIPPGILPNSLSSRLVDESFYTYGVGAQIPIFVPSLWFLYSARQKGEKISELVENLTTKLTTLQVTGEYYYILALQSEEKYLLDDLKAAKELERKAKVSLKVDAILPWELDKASTLVKAKESSLRNNQRDLLVAKMNLMKSLNLSPLTNFTLEDVEVGNISPLPPLDECIFQAISGNEVLKITSLSKDISKDVKKIAISNFLPKIILGGGYINNSNEIFADPSFLYGNVSGILSIFNGFKNVNEYKKAVRQQKISELKLEKEFLTTVIETTKAYNNVVKSMEMCEIANLNFKAEEGKLRQKKVEKKVDMIDDEEYFKTLASYNQALSLKKKADFQYEIALGALNIAMGKEPLKKGEKNNEI
ncbi:MULTISPECIES: TolC family protein [Fusobacterium]|uniref:TolC family protein n=1 Tax=Fusobacterium TaxID=848 RepID=UPI00147717BB|nr:MULTISPECIES: TolC family protein [Fusobacterium]NME35299.1 TolC family protein [Fusobacterium sp. FSA-380-WT-3A]